MNATVSPEDIARYESIINALSPMVRQEPEEDEEPGAREWFVAFTNPNCEGRVIKAMNERGIATLAPVIRYWRTRNRKRVQDERQLMPRYVIFGMDRARHNLIGIEGLERIVRSNDRSWSRVPEWAVALLRMRMLSGEFDPSVGRVSNFLNWLVAQGEMPAAALVETPDTKNRTARNRLSRVKRKKKR
ncbi:transcription termination/antitermination NusG family protein [Enterovirga sp. CN4-39]|uniref:transcription termination/antitermination NusG family protein n=1 Tax=Enterovirga sp. CN4-39 TaxID=3400910 RepID=UPI003C11EC6C